MQGGPDRHDFHHSHNVGNFGSFFIFWDWICGTDYKYRAWIESKTGRKYPGDAVLGDEKVKES